MKNTVEFTAGARQDLQKIYHYIKKAGRPKAAKQLYQQLSESCSSLSQNPERGHIPPEFEGLSTLLCRQIVINKYRIIYQVIGEVVIIQGIIDGRRTIRETLRQRLLI